MFTKVVRCCGLTCWSHSHRRRSLVRAAQRAQIVHHHVVDLVRRTVCRRRPRGLTMHWPGGRARADARRWIGAATVQVELLHIDHIPQRADVGQQAAVEIDELQIVQASQSPEVQHLVVCNLQSFQVEGVLDALGISVDGCGTTIQHNAPHAMRAAPARPHAGRGAAGGTRRGLSSFKAASETWSGPLGLRAAVESSPPSGTAWGASRAGRSIRERRTTRRAGTANGRIPVKEPHAAATAYSRMSLRHRFPRAQVGDDLHMLFSEPGKAKRSRLSPDVCRAATLPEATLASNHARCGMVRSSEGHRQPLATPCERERPMLSRFPPPCRRHPWPQTGSRPLPPAHPTAARPLTLKMDPSAPASRGYCQSARREPAIARQTTSAASLPRSG